MEHLIQSLRLLKEQHGLTGLKGGTEVEAMRFDEIFLMRRISRGIVPMTVKIGGPEARNDMDFMLATGVDTILAPMIESPYGLKNFVATMDALDPEHRASLAINIETIFACSNLEAIFTTPWFNRISQVTVGRSDLAGSMGLDVDHPAVQQHTCEIIRLARSMGKHTSVGGQVSVDNAEPVQKLLPSDTVNTRHMVVSLNSSTITADIRAALLWERDFYLFLEQHFPGRKEFYRKRISSIETRCAGKEHNGSNNSRIYALAGSKTAVIGQ